MKAFDVQKCIFISERLRETCLLAVSGSRSEFHATSHRENFRAHFFLKIWGSNFNYIRSYILLYFAGQKKVVKGCLIKTATHATFNHVFLISRVQDRNLNFTWEKSSSKRSSSRKRKKNERSSSLASCSSASCSNGGCHKIMIFLQSRAATYKRFCYMFSESSPCLLCQHGSCSSGPTACGTLRKHVTKRLEKVAAPECRSEKLFFTF